MKHLRAIAVAVLIIGLLPIGVFAAISFDAVAQGGVNPGASTTFSHTTSGNDRIILVEAVTNAATDTITGVTYNGVALTKINTVQVPTENQFISLWYLTNPASGANDVVISNSDSGKAVWGNSVSYTGAATTQTNIISSSDTLTRSANTEIVYILTTVDDNARVVVAHRSGLEPAAGTGTVERIQNAAIDAGTAMYDNNENKTPTGSVSQTVTFSSSVSAGIMAQIAPVVVVTDNIGGIRMGFNF